MLKLIKLSWALPVCAAAALTGCAANTDSVTSINAVPSANLALYKSQIPKYMGFAASTKPQTMLQAGRLNEDNGFLEARLFIRVNYANKDYWWGLDQPINNQFGYDNGLPIGYPKRLVEICRSDTGTVMQYKIDNCASPKITITHTVVPNTVVPNSDTLGQITLGTDGCLKDSPPSTTTVLVTSKTRVGKVTTVNNYPSNTVWKPLFPNGEKPGVVQWTTDTLYSYPGSDLKCGVVFP